MTTMLMVILLYFVLCLRSLFSFLFSRFFYKFNFLILCFFSAVFYFSFLQQNVKKKKYIKRRLVRPVYITLAFKCILLLIPIHFLMCFFFEKIDLYTRTRTIERTKWANFMCSLINKYVKLLFSFILLQIFFVLYFFHSKASLFCVLIISQAQFNFDMYFFWLHFHSSSTNLFELSNRMRCIKKLSHDITFRLRRKKRHVLIYKITSNKLIKIN